MSKPFAAFALALIAVSLLVFQPVCEAEEQHLAEGESCYSIGAAAPAQAANTAADGAGAATLGAPAGFPAVRPPMPGRAAARSLAPPPLARYHARSARIQR